MSKQSSLHDENDESLHYEISIRNEYTRFACMFYLFTLLALLTTIFLFLFANNSYYNESESIQRRFIPYSVLGSISLALFFVFLLGSLVYTGKLIKKLRGKPTSNSSSSPHLIKKLIPRTKPPSFVLNTDESYSTTSKSFPEQKSRTSSYPCQTDV